MLSRPPPLSQARQTSPRLWGLGAGQQGRGTSGAEHNPWPHVSPGRAFSGHGDLVTVTHLRWGPQLRDLCTQLLCCPCLSTLCLRKKTSWPQVWGRQEHKWGRTAECSSWGSWTGYGQIVRLSGAARPARHGGRLPLLAGRLLSPQLLRTQTSSRICRRQGNWKPGLLLATVGQKPSTRFYILLE